MYQAVKAFLGVLLTLAMAASIRPASAQSAPDAADARGHHFAARSGRVIYHRGQPFRMAGSNNYYPMYVIEGFFVYFSGGGTFYLDNVRTQVVPVEADRGARSRGALVRGGIVHSPHSLALKLGRAKVVDGVSRAWAVGVAVAKARGETRGAFCCALLLVLLGLVPERGLAQTASASPHLVAAAMLPDAPGYDPASQAQAAALSGTVLDTNGGVVPGATVTLLSAASAQAPASSRVASTDGNGFFRFAGVPPGSYQVTIAANGFASWARTGIQVQPGHDQDLAGIALPLTSTTTNVQVIFSGHLLAARQVHAQEKQRVLGILPNFYTSFVWQAEPMSPGQKFQLAYRSVTDPLTFVGAAGVAGIEQWGDTYPGFGQGAAGYGKRLGAAYGDLALSTTFSNALLPVLLRQDPRYFFKGSGSTSSRALYALTRTVITRGDDGRSEPNYSNVVGDFAAASIGNLYYPARDSGASVTVTNAMISIGFSAIDGLFRELLAPDITTGSPTRGKP